MCSYPHCMQLYGGCGQGCTDALASRGRRKDKIGGMTVVADKNLPVGRLEFHHPDGRIDRFEITK